jgi:cell volume regulation protein A
MGMDVNLFLLLIASIIAIGFFSNWIFVKTRIPDLIWLLLLGLMIGPVFGIFDQTDAISLAPFFSAIALLIILFDSGLNMKLYKLIQEVPSGFVLAIVSFVFSIAIVTLSSFYILNLPLPLSILLGVIVGGTSSAIVIPIISQMPEFREKPSLILDVESAVSDALCIVVAIVVMQLIATTGLGVAAISVAAKAVTASLSIAIVMGFICGVFWFNILGKISQYRYYYMLTLAFLFFMYPAVELLGGNGPIACLTFGLVLGNSKAVAKSLRIRKEVSGLERKTLDFNSHISFFVRAFFFVFLGTIVTMTDFFLFAYGILLALLILGVRWAAVRLSTFKLKLGEIEKRIMTFMIPRGLAAAVLVAMPSITYGIAGTGIFADIVFSVIISTAIISTIGIFVFGRRLEEEEKK